MVDRRLIRPALHGAVEGVEERQVDQGGEEPPLEPGHGVPEIAAELVDVPQPTDGTLGGLGFVGTAGALLLPARRQVRGQLLAHPGLTRPAGPDRPHGPLDAIHEQFLIHAGAPRIRPTIVTNCVQSSRRRDRSRVPLSVSR